MSTALPIAAFVMGLAGAPHCAAMCGAACGGALRARERGGAGAMLQFQLGRFLAYTAAGVAVGSAMQGLAWMATHAAGLRPAWTAFHLAVLAWGLALLVLGRQPVWAARTGRAVRVRIRPLARARGGLLAVGGLWVLMPCGLLYSALLVAALSGGAWQGGLSMALFALGSGTGLVAFPLLLAGLRRAGGAWSARFGGALLAGAAGWAVWMDLAHRLPDWCRPG